MTFSIHHNIQRILLIIAFTAICGAASATGGDAMEPSKRECDSLKNILKTKQVTEQEELNIYFTLAGVYSRFDMDSVIFYGTKAIILAEKLNETDVAIFSRLHVGVAFCLLNKYDTAIVILDKARQLAVATDNPLKHEALWLTAFVYVNQGKYIAAIDLYIKLLPVYERRNNMGIYVAALCNLAELNRKLGNMGIALQYLDKAASLCGKLKSDLYTWRITQIYNEYATVYLLKDDIGKAFEYAMKSDSINQGGFVINKCTAKVLLAKIYLRLGDDKRALQYAGEAMTFAGMLKNNNLYIDVWKVLSDIYLSQGRYHEAEIEALKAWQADSTNINESRFVVANLVIANIYMHNTKKAIYYFKKYSELNDLYTEKSFHTTISDLTVKYETEKREMRMYSMKRQRLLHVFISIAGILFAAAVWIVSRQKIRKERSEKQLIALRSILEGENSERESIAHKLQDGINEIIMSAKTELAAMDDTQCLCNRLDECIEEVNRIAAGMMPSSLIRFGIKTALENYCSQFPHVIFHFDGEDKRIDEKIEVAVYYCACELVNNSVKHSNATVINVQMIQDNNRVALTVQDNGRGFDPQSVTKGLGLKNIRYRIITFNGTMDINTSPNNGVKTNIEFFTRKQKEL